MGGDTTFNFCRQRRDEMVRFSATAIDAVSARAKTFGDPDMGEELQLLERRISQLEHEVSLLKSHTTEQGDRPWWERIAGRFENDPAFDEIVRLGREYRDSLSSEEP